MERVVDRLDRYAGFRSVAQFLRVLFPTPRRRPGAPIATATSAVTDRSRPSCRVEWRFDMCLMYGHDFSELSTSTASAAAALAMRLDLPLVLVHVRDELQDSLDPEAAARLAGRAREQLETLVADVSRAWPGCRPRAVVVRGHVAAELASAAARERAQLLVVSSGTHTGPLWKIGTISERVAVEAECPVLVLRAGKAFETWARDGASLRVLLGVSDDAACAGAVRWTSRLRTAGRCDVIAAGVYSPPAEQLRYGLTARLAWTEPDAELERLVARDIARRVGPLDGDGSLEIHATLGLGRPADHLLHLAEQSAVDLIIVGTHRTRGLGRLASVSGAVLHHGRTSVLLVPAPGDKEKTVPELRRILVAADLSPASAAAVAHGLSLARAANGELLLLHVVEGDEQRASVTAVLAAQLRALGPQPAGVPVQAAVVGARDPDRAIVSAAERLDADVVCLASHARGGIARVTLGSVAERVVRSCRPPVLVVHPERD